MEVAYQPYIDPEYYDSLIERIYPARVCIDNETYEDCTLVKVDSANKNGMLLEMVQVLADLDLVISKSYISTDGGWFMDVFHVTDQMGNKLTDQSLMLYIQEALCATRRGSPSKEIRPSPAIEFTSRHLHMPSDHTAIEMTGTDHPGLLSEISAALAEQACHVADVAMWTHHTRAACILYIEDNNMVGAITDPARLAQIEEQLENIVEAHDKEGERRRVTLAAPVAGRMHTERRLHQLMFADRDYEMCCECCGGSQCGDSKCVAAHVSIESWEEKGYSVVNVRSRDRPKLLFDTVCALTDMQYVVFHAAIRSEGSIAKQQGLRLDVSWKDRPRLLSDVTRTLRENGLTITRADLTTRGEKAMGSLYVAEVSGHEVDPDTIESVRKVMGGSVRVMNGSNNSRNWSRRRTTHQGSSDGNNNDSNSSNVCNNNSNSNSSTITKSHDSNESKLSLGGLLWAQIEKFSKSFGPIRL